jgi:hypothetical protein
MQDKQVSIFENEGQTLSPRTQQLISHLENVWKRPHNQSSENLKQITEFLSQLPEPYKVLGMTKIAEYLASEMSLHFLDLLATFQQKAENEGIDREELVETLQGAISEFFPEMMGISKQVLIKSLDDLITLSNITLSLYTLSQAKTAEEAQDWIYELPVLYGRQLAQERLITSIQAQFKITQNTTTMSFSGSVSWKSSLPSPVTIDTTTLELPTIA